MERIFQNERALDTAVDIRQKPRLHGAQWVRIGFGFQFDGADEWIHELRMRMFHVHRQRMDGQMAIGYLQVFDDVQDGDDNGKPAENGAGRLHQRIHNV